MIRTFGVSSSLIRILGGSSAKCGVGVDADGNNQSASSAFLTRIATAHPFPMFFEKLISRVVERL